MVFPLTVYVIAQFTNLSDDRDLLISLAFLTATLAIAILDSENLHKVGVHLSAWWWLLLPPLYLLMRAIKLRRDYLLFVVSIGSYLLWGVLGVELLSAPTSSPQ